MTQVHVIGVGSTVFGQHSARLIKDLVREAVREALGDAGIAPGQVEAAYFANSTQGYFEGQHAIRGPVALREFGLYDIPIVSVEAACAGGATALGQAVIAVRAGAADIALAVGAEKMFWPGDRERMLAAFDSGWDVADPEANFSQLSELSPKLRNAGLGRARSVFMDIYSAFCDFHMRTFGTTREQIAAVSAKNHAHSVHNDRSQFRKTFTREEVLAAPEVVWPLTVPMCAPVSDGASAVVVASEAAVRRLGVSYARSPIIAATVAKTGVPRRAAEFDKHVGRLAALAAYEGSGVAPGDVSVAEVHDATAMGEIIQSENLGFCPFGDGGALAERGETSIGGRIPINPSGGLESKGHPLGATGLGQVYELVLQLRGDAGPRQVEGARVGVAENGGGLIGIEEATCAVTVLVRASAPNGAKTGLEVRA